MDQPRTLQSPVKSGLPRLSMLPTPQPVRTLASPSKVPSLSSRVSSLPSKAPGVTSPTKSMAAPGTNRRVSGIARPSSALGQTPLSPTKPTINLTATRRVSSIGALPNFSPTKPAATGVPGRRVSGIVPPAPRTASALANRTLSPTKTIARTPAKPNTRPAPSTAVNTRARPKSVHMGAISRTATDEASDRLGALTSFSSRTGQRDPYASPTTSPGSSPLISNAGDRPQTSSGNSLYDRTIESLAQLPSTPSSVSDRRRSGVFVAESPANSPMGPPPRPVSSAALPRRSSTLSGRSLARPASSVKTSATPTLSRTSSVPSRPLTTRRSLSANIPKAAVPSSTAPTAVRGVPPSAKRLSLQTKPVTITKGPAAASTRHKMSASVSHISSARTPSPSEQPLSSKSTSSFRQAIEKAKAAKAIHSAPATGHYDVDIDPFNQQRRDGDLEILRTRINTALKDGKLNISGLGLDKIPTEVLQMYEPQALAQCEMARYEVMDLTSLNAAGNNLSTMTDQDFPDVSPEEAYHDDSLRASIFAVVERMNLRGNQLLGLPLGMRHLRRLTTLDLSRNELGNSIFDILPELTCLRELNLADNNISGFLPQTIGSLTKLESLDIRNNRVLNVPESIRFMTDLKILNVSGNQLTGVPMDAIECLPIRELDVSNNALVGALFPFGVTGLKEIQELNISNNSLASLSFSENVALPNIRILKVSNNRIVAFPDMSGWTELVTLAAGGNKMDTLPQGFVTLKRIRNADFSSNDITRLDERLAQMDSLESLVITANPLIDRKFLTMTADAIKRDLRSRTEPPMYSQRTSSNFEDEAIDVRSPKPSPANIKFTSKGELDLSGQNLIDQDADGLRSLLGVHDVRSLQLSRNKFTIIPYELSLAQNLISLDLSMCNLGSLFLDEPLTLMSLQYLQLSGNSITSLQPLMELLRAPYLRQLDVSNNRLAGELPMLRHTFEHLQELYASDNHIDTVSTEALQGLGTVVLARNDIAQLPAEIGLLAFEGLKTIDFSSNAFRVPSHAVLEKGTEATLTWLRGKIPNYAGDDETF